MGPKSAIPVLLLLLGSLGCRTAAPVPPAVSVEEDRDEELRVYAVGDLLGKFDGVPLRGCCVMPYPQLSNLPRSAVIFSFASGQDPRPSMVQGEDGIVGGSEDAGDGEPGKVEVDSARRRTLELRAEAARQEGLERETMRKRSPLFQEPHEALLDHLRSRLAIGVGTAEFCRLAVLPGDALEARGTPAALAAIERALAELR